MWRAVRNDPPALRRTRGLEAFAPFEVFVADFGNHRVQVFDREGAFLRSWGEFGAEPGQFNNPIGLQLGPAGNVRVVDSGSERVQVFSQQGELLLVFADVGVGPQIISLNAAGEFYVSSPCAEGRVRRFSPEGELLGYVGDSVSGLDLLAMTNAERLRVSELSPLTGPHGTSTDAAGSAYSPSSGRSRRSIPRSPRCPPRRRGAT